MNPRRRILVLNNDDQVLIRLEQLLEDAGLDTTTTWDMQEALHLAQSRRFDLMLVGDHPPEVCASEILRELECSNTGVPCAILQCGSGLFAPEFFYSLGASAVIANWRTIDLSQWILERFDVQRAAAACG